MGAVVLGLAILALLLSFVEARAADSAYMASATHEPTGPSPKRYHVPEA